MTSADFPATTILTAVSSALQVLENQTGSETQKTVSRLKQLETLAELSLQRGDGFVTLSPEDVSIIAINPTQRQLNG